MKKIKTHKWRKAPAKMALAGAVLLGAWVMAAPVQAMADSYTLRVPFSWKGNLHASVRAITIYCSLYRGDTSTHNSGGAVATKTSTQRHDANGATATMIFNNISGPVGSYSCHLKASKNSSGSPDEFLVTGTARDPWLKAGPGSVLSVRDNIQ